MTREPPVALPAESRPRSPGGNLRIALFTGAYDHIRDGVALTLNRVVTYLEHAQIPVRVFAPGNDTPAVAHAGELVRVRSVPAPGRSEYRIALGISARARRALMDFRPTLFHVATPDLLGLHALRRAGRSGVPVVASYHTHFSSYLGYYGLSSLEDSVWRYLRWFYARCAHVYVPTSSMAAVLRAHGITENLRCWPRGVDTFLFDPARRSTEWRREVGASDSEPIVAFVSRLVPEKGIRVLGDVLGKLRQQGVPHRPVIVGDGPSREALQSRLPHAHFAGTLTGDELARAYASSDVFIFPSETETFGNVTLEAMASGLPVVAADAPGSSSLVQHGVTGFLAAGGRADQFTDYVVRLVSDAGLRRSAGAASRQAALEYDWEAVLARLLAYYREVA